MAKRANKKICFVVDLTNTDRYYKKTEWADQGVKYLKLNCPGHDVNEREDLVEGFIKSVSEFVEDPENEEKLVGVHCTHGINRTGYLICRSMIDVNGYSAADAISMFEYYRGHPMERQHYIIALYEAAQRRNAEKMKPKEDDENTRKEEVGDMTTD
ncbi:hypothetical protein B9Z55_028475 [Caenorhabditis nigoni]|uniref:Uncharacterized protein n=1 Tax=Caenorhabditis nigoni TaxID=1611254 RepID=A0A2G5SBQ0_9PELO|nr:hypothetical protein B9Z55_028475 [Caenorhabditis nigoni]